MDDLTPIRVRGARNGVKRRSPFVKSTTSSKRRHTLQTPRTNVESSSSLSALSSRSRLKLSAIEKLPLEILETIFTLEANVNLPLSSPILGKALSSEKMFTMSTFTWFLKHDVDHDGQAETAPDAAILFQINSLLCCRWMNWTRFTSIMTKIVTARITDDSREDALQALHLTEPWRQPKVPQLRLGPDVRIPVKLLRGPWSADQSHFLYYLCFLGLRVDWDHSVAGEVAMAGLEEAIRSRDRRAVAAVLSDQVMVLPTQDNLRNAIIQYGCDQTIIFHLLHACLRAKSRERSGSAEYGTLVINPLDPTIWSWLKRFEDTDNSKAVWLKNALTTTARMMNDTSSTAAQQYQDFSDACGRGETGVQDIPIPV